MKDIIEFPVVGTQFVEKGFFSLEGLVEGTVLKLVPETDNLYDPLAIKVIAKDHIGYVPNKGATCKLCWTHMKPDDNHCRSCGASWDYVIQGGLATRLSMTKSLEKQYACVVIKLDKDNKFSPVVAKLILE